MVSPCSDNDAVVGMKYDACHHAVFEVDMKLGACGDALGPVVADMV